MIIKSKSYKKEGDYRRLVNYVLKDGERENSFVLTRFIKGKEPSKEQIIAQFERNENCRLYKRKNNVKLFMDILSFHKDNAKDLTNEKLKKIARKYISLRSNLSVALATVHRDKEHIHLHILLSGTEYKTGKSIRISKADFRDKVKVPAEQFVQKNFPELEKSAINHKKESKVKIKDAEYQMNQRGKLSDKQILIGHLEDAYKKATSEKDFYTILQNQNLDLYTRKNGMIAGVKMKRNQRFSTLGYTKQILQDLDKSLSKNSRLATLGRIREFQQSKKQQSKGRERIRG